MKKIFLLLPFILLTGCSLFEARPTPNLDDACAIVQARPSWKRQMQKVEKRWELPVSVQMAIIWQESKFAKRAKTGRKYILGFIPAGRVSSAYGYAQVIDGTWDWYRKDTGKRRARRDNFGDAVDFMGWYTDITTRKYGVPKSDVRNQYLAYHEGHGGYKRKSYNKKAWLVQVANNLVGRERMYRRQLKNCWM